MRENITAAAAGRDRRVDDFGDARRTFMRRPIVGPRGRLAHEIKRDEPEVD
ncbi:MAG: hypothetical protein JO105_23260 [Hyphomicrobiales bacterium]|nr:hypothetical protein [Hyphomicrobiales bacterium]MBV9978316.1 hypothetical protein [Hyphomicrobiales bacterium]